MKNLLTLLSILLLFTPAIAQNGGVEIDQAVCEDSELYTSEENFTIKRFKRKYNVHLKINGFKVGQGGAWQIARLDYSEKIKYETQLIPLNDSVAVQIQITRTEHNKMKELHSKLIILYLDGECWRPNNDYRFYKVDKHERKVSQMSAGGYENMPYVALDNIKISID